MSGKITRFILIIEHPVKLVHNWKIFFFHLIFYKDSLFHTTAMAHVTHRLHPILLLCFDLQANTKTSTWYNNIINQNFIDNNEVFNYLFLFPIFDNILARSCCSYGDPLNFRQLLIFLNTLLYCYFLMHKFYNIFLFSIHFWGLLRF